MTLWRGVVRPSFVGLNQRNLGRCLNRDTLTPTVLVDGYLLWLELLLIYMTCNPVEEPSHFGLVAITRPIATFDKTLH